MTKQVYLDRGILFVSLFLMGLGLVQVYSSSFIFAIEKYDDGLFFFRKQSIFFLLAVMTMLVAARLPWRVWQVLGATLFLVSVVGVGLTYVAGLGVKVGGAHRWIQLPLSLRVEPSEFLKVLLPLWMAFLATRGWKEWGWVRKGLASVSLIIPLVLLLGQPDFGSFAICTLVILGILFCLGLSWKWVSVGVLTAATGFYFLIVRVPYRMARLTSFMDPWGDPEAKGFQVIQSMLSYYSGGITGTGIGQGQGKLFFLPEAHTDFTASVLGEETGFLGLIIVLSLFGFLILRGFQVASRSRETSLQVVALGATLIFALNTIFNFGVSMGLLPTKGLALPFISYGGSSLIASAMAIGLLLNVDRQTRMQKLSSFKGIKVVK